MTQPPQPNAASDGDRRLERIVAILLALGTVLLFGPTLRHNFINYDDPLFVMENPIVNQGLTWDGMILALATNHADYWRPLSWLSHMIDVELFGMRPGGHHLTNVLWHTGAAVVLLLALNRMTRALWCSAFVAALFAWHPLHVESVAWVGERKDVMCGFFWFLTMLAYWRYTTRPTRLNFVLTLVSFLLGLMSKPMIVTLPFVLLLLDFWPLGRFKWPAPRDQPGRAGAEVWLSLWPLVLEKLPFLILAALASVATFIGASEAGAMRTLENVPLPARIANSAVAYATYLARMIWPVDLAVFYPLQTWPAGRVILSLVVLAGVTAVAFRLRRTASCLLVGWLWFLGSLVPVIGLVQVGTQAMADRYTYIPLVGLFIAVAWSAAAWAGAEAQRRKMLAVAAVILLCGCVAVTARQVPHWRNSTTLYEHAIAVTQKNWMAHNNLGSELFDAGRTEDAARHFSEALRIHPAYADASFNLGMALAALGRHAEARAHFARALAQQSEQVKIAAALTRFAETAQKEPSNPEASYYLATALASVGRTAEAIPAFETVLRLKPDYAEAHEDFGALLGKTGRQAEAAEHLQRAMQLRSSRQNP